MTPLFFFAEKFTSLIERMKVYADYICSKDWWPVGLNTGERETVPINVKTI